MYSFFFYFLLFIFECSHFIVTRVLFTHPIKTRGEKKPELKKNTLLRERGKMKIKEIKQEGKSPVIPTKKK